MSYNQGTGNLQRDKVSVAVILGSSNGAAAVSFEGNKANISVTLNGTLNDNTDAGPITITNSVIKATSVIESCVQTNIQFSAFDVYDVPDGSCKLNVRNHVGAPVAGNPTSVFSLVIYN